MNQPQGRLVLIGGYEMTGSAPSVLTEVVKSACQRSGRVVLITVAAEEPDALASIYRTVFARRGATSFDVLDIHTRAQTSDEAHLALLREAATIVLTGHDQLRLTSLLGGSLVSHAMREAYVRGATIIGTAAGAAALPAHMIVARPHDDARGSAGREIVSGLGFLDRLMVDSHFGEHGRLDRLLGAVAQNPHNLGVGIDADTAIVITQATVARVVGAGAVSILDGTTISSSRLPTLHEKRSVGIAGVTLHVLGAYDLFDLRVRRPVQADDTVSNTTP